MGSCRWMMDGGLVADFRWGVALDCIGDWVMIGS